MENIFTGSPAVTGNICHHVQINTTKKSAGIGHAPIEEAPGIRLARAVAIGKKILNNKSLTIF